VSSSESFDADFAVIGSGFGGSVAALRLAEKGYRVVVLERGKRLGLSDFPATNLDVRKYLWMPRFGWYGPQNMSLFRHMLVLSGSGVGGGSLVYAGVLEEAPDAFFSAPGWSALADWKRELAPHYDTARRMLGVVPNPCTTPADVALTKVAERAGRAHAIRPANMGVLFDAEPGRGGREIPDPYFGGDGPARTTCTLCGGCMVGCRFGAKNSLDRNYLYFAERRGARIVPEATVTTIRALGALRPEDNDGSDGYEIAYRSSTDSSAPRQTLRVGGVVLAAGAMSSNALLLGARDGGHLPRLSKRLGDDVRLNNEEILFATTGRTADDFTRSAAATSRYLPDDKTSMILVRFPPGSWLMRLLSVPWLRAAWRALRGLFTRRWAETTAGFVVMQAGDDRIRLGWRRSLWTLFRRGLVTQRVPGSRVPAKIPSARAAVASFANELGAAPAGTVNAELAGITTTVHVFGGCGMGRDADEGVVDTSQRVFGYRSFYVCDGSVITANVGGAPTLTITALAERCMASIPPRASRSRA